MWQSQLIDGSDDAVVFRVFHSDGSPRTDELMVNITTLGRQRHPTISASSDGFVAVWESETASPAEGFAIQGRRFGSDGQAVGGEFQVNEIAAGDQYYVDMAPAGDDRFIVAWSSDDCAGCNNEVEGSLVDLNAIFDDGFESGETSRLGRGPSPDPVSSERGPAIHQCLGTVTGAAQVGRSSKLEKKLSTVDQFPFMS